MMFLETWVETPTAEALGWTLLHSLWQGAVIAALLGVVLLATRSARVRYAAACAALLLLVGAFAFTFSREMPQAASGSRVTVAAFPALNAAGGGEAVPSLTPDLAAAVPWLAPLWVAGVWISCFWHVAGWMSVRRLRRRGVCCAPEDWQRQLARLAAQLHLSRPIRLLESSLAEAPMVVGHLRPLILMPVGVLSGLPAAQIEAILLHELAHIRRHDYLVNLAQRSIEGLLFYHPAAWWISRVIRTERENCCDDVVVAMSGNAHEYAVALTALEQNRWSGREPAVAATGGSLVKRIRRLLYPKGPNGAWTPLLAGVILVASAAALAALPSPLPQTAAEIEAVAAKGEAAATKGASFERWLTRDAAYIIAEAERAAFLRLTTDAERDKFIEQFWERRDPTPGNSVNEFQQEHYRRIEYSNARYATPAGKPGWQTDRGRIYIVYGPAREIETHPSGEAHRPSPYEIWRYQHVDGIGDDLWITFIDHTGSGDYQIAPGTVR